jgi:ATP/maltotriose-dependent transcriptional regulator MalT/DNA-binding SARP family transcriptional activator
VLSERLVRRPRLERLVDSLLDEHRLLVVCATAGAGKTTSVVQAGERRHEPPAWLTVDTTDRAPGRLLTYLEAALARRVPQVAGTIARALGAGIGHVEAAGLLAQRLEGSPVTLVLDDVERVSRSEHAVEVLSALARYAPPQVRMILISRGGLTLDLGSDRAAPFVATIGEADLAFTVEEAAGALALADGGAVDPAAAVEATGGWVAGVLFEAWRSTDHINGAGGEADPLHGYLATQILEPLDQAEVEFLVGTSVLDEVTVARADALGMAGSALDSVRRKHLPVVWSADGRSMRAHPRFREYLQHRLERQGTARVRSLRIAHSRLLRAEGHDEEAVEELLRAQETGLARAAAESALQSVVDRLDFDVAERWLERIDPPGAVVTDAIALSRLTLAIGREQYASGAALGDRLGVDDRLALAARSARAASMLAWCYWHVLRLDDGRELLKVAPEGREVDAVRALFGMCSDGPIDALPDLADGGGSPIDGLLVRIAYYRGDLQRLAATTPESPWVTAVGAPWMLSRLRSTGHLEAAHEAYRSSSPPQHGSVYMQAVVAVELMLELGRPDEARELARAGRSLIAKTGSRVYDQHGLLIAARLALQLDGDTTSARRLLELAREDAYPFLREVIDTRLGRIDLIDGRVAEAQDRLRGAVASMLMSNRILELPAAAVFLSEAEWRMQDEEASDRAAAIALDAARRQGTNHLLLQALAEFPAVATRQMDAQADGGSTWHDIGRALVVTGVRRSPALDEPLVRLADLGNPRILVDGEQVRPRIRKSVELLAFLLARDERRASHEELLDALFAGRSDRSSRSYLRQAIFRLREVLPDGLGPVVDAGIVGLGRPDAYRSDAATLERALVEAASLRGRDRLAALCAIIDGQDGASYLGDTGGDWAAERRHRMAEQLASARLDAATLAFEHGEYPRAQKLVDRLLADDPLSEKGWRLAMSLADALGDGDRVISTYHRCEKALEGLGLSPSKVTAEHLSRLRTS